MGRLINGFLRLVAHRVAWVFGVLSCSAWALPPTFSASYDNATIGPNNQATLTFLITNVEAFPVTDLAFTNTFPAGVTLATNPQAETSCNNGTIVANGGDSSFSISGYSVEPSSSCTVSVVVQSAVAGSYLNTSDSLTSSEGNSGTASATLTVDSGRPGVSISLTPSTLNRGDNAVLQVTYDNTSNASIEYNFQGAVALPTGLVVADYPAAQTTCTNYSVSATAGATAITASPAGTMTLAAGATCDFSVNVTGSGVGDYIVPVTLTYLDSGTFSQTNPGFASTGVSVEQSYGQIALTQNPTAPGSSNNLSVTLYNFDRSSSASNVNLTIDLDAALSGLVATGLPLSNVCGSGSSLTGTSLINLTGGAIAAESSCTFNIPVSVPAGAAVGSYSGSSSTINMDIDGATQVRSAANFSITLTQAPELVMAFVDDNVVTGNSTDVEFTITNTDTVNSATAMSFSANLSEMISGATIASLPATGFCGAGSTASQSIIVDQVNLNISGANLAAAGSCTFTVGINIPDGGVAGNAILTAENFVATVNGSTFSGTNSSDSINVVGGPSIQLSLSDFAANPGDTVIASFELSHDANAGVAASNMAFTLDLDGVISGLTAVGLPSSDVCGSGSSISGTSSLTFTGGTLNAGDTCNFDVTLQLPASVTSGQYTLISSNLTATVAGLSTSSIAGQADLQVTNLVASMSFSADVAPGDTAEVSITLDNTSTTEALTDIVWTASLTSMLSGTSAIGLPQSNDCGAGSSLSGTNTLIFSGGNLATSTSCTFTVTMTIAGGASEGTYALTSSNISFTEGGSGVVIAPMVASLAVVVDSAPTVTLSSTAEPSTSVSPIPVTITFNEDVSGFELADITGSVTNGTLSNFQTLSASQYSVDITPAAAGDVTLQVPAAVAVDAGANDNGASAVLTVDYDPVAFILPTATIGAPDLALTNTGPVNFVVTYSNADQVDLDASEVNLISTGDAAATVAVSNGSTTTPTVTLSNISGDGTLAISIVAATARNSFGNADAISASSSFDVDNTSPTLAISSASSDPTNVPFSASFTFSEAVSDFTVGDITVGNGSATGVSGGPLVYSALITPAGDGTVTVDVAADAAIDSAGNGNTAASQFSLEYDATAPSGYDINIDQSFLNASNDTAMSFTYTGAEVGAGYSYSVSDGVTSVTASGTVTSASDVISAIDVSGLAEGTLTLSFTLTDPVGNVGIAITDTVVKQYNDAPVITEGASVVVVMSEDADPTAFSLTLNATDPENETLSWSVTGAAANGIASASGSGNSQVINYTPSANFNGNDSFTVTVTDNNALDPLTDSIVVDVQINPVNDQPSFSSTAVLAVNEDAIYSYAVTTSDIDSGDTHTITATTLPTWLSLIDNLDGTATLTGSPTNDDVGANSVTLVVTDSSGAANDSATQSFTIVVANTNDAPTFTSTAVTAATEDASYSYAITTADVDVGDTVSLSATQLPAWLTLTDNGDGTGSLSGTPLNADVGANNVTLVVTDDSGAGNDNSAQSFVITVANTNDLPTGLPVITGTPLRTETLLADTSAISDDDGLGAFSYQWLRAGVPIAGATANNYLLGVDDVWQTISVTVSYTDLGGANETLTSATTAPIADLDSDGDGIYDLEEGTGDSDGDGIPDYLDTDSDNDGIPDAEEGTSDTDGDGTPDYLDDSLDEDGDGIPDIIETDGNTDTDGDGIPDFNDADSDNDGLTDGEESGALGVDSDGDGIDDYYDVDQTGGVDSNGDGIDDAVRPLDSDQDGTPDYIDRDSDNDLIPDALESDAALRMLSLGKLLNFNRRVALDTDGDGILNHVDSDSDNDGIPDVIEAQVAAVDSDGDQIVDQFDVDQTGGADANADGVDDAAVLINSDNDQVPDLLDLDSDNDGLFDISEAGLIDSDFDALIDNPTDAIVVAPDSDNDGLPDYLDLDSNDDGQWDIALSGASSLDLNNDGQIDDASSDPDSDGIVDPYDDEPNQFGTAPDRDGDGVPGRIDADDDNDGISDIVEGILDSDGDGLIDALDSDSDNDGLNDAFEASRPVFLGVDSDRDGIDDSVDVDFAGGADANNDGISDIFLVPDSDADGRPDYLDSDSDNDGISDTEEQLLVTLSGTDIDLDGLDDAVDASQNSGLDVNADGQLDSSFSLDDLDGDGLLAFRDADTDGDGISDSLENADYNGDGINDRLQAEQDVDVPDSGSLSWLLALAALGLLRRGNRLPLLGLFALSSISVAHAETPSCALAPCWYGGFTAGQTKFSLSDQASSWRVIDDSGQRAEVLIGASLSEHFYLEASYTRLGKVLLQNQNPNFNSIGQIDFSAMDFSFGVLLHPNAHSWNLGVDAGMSKWDGASSSVPLADFDDSVTFYRTHISWRLDKDSRIKLSYHDYSNDAEGWGLTIIQEFD